MSNFINHCKTVRKHRKYVRKMCWKLGLLWQGLTHDLSKYSITELKICKYYTGTCSPHEECRRQLGYSPVWMHHYMHNKHHFQHYRDDDDKTGAIIPIKMPFKYVLEMFCDRIAASKTYAENAGNVFKPNMPYQYYLDRCRGKDKMHNETEILLAFLLQFLALNGENYTFIFIKNNKRALEEAYVNSKDLSKALYNIKMEAIL